MRAQEGWSERDECQSSGEGGAAATAARAAGGGGENVFKFFLCVFVCVFLPERLREGGKEEERGSLSLKLRRAGLGCNIPRLLLTSQFD